MLADMPFRQKQYRSQVQNIRQQYSVGTYEDGFFVEFIFLIFIYGKQFVFLFM